MTLPVEYGGAAPHRETRSPATLLPVNTLAHDLTNDLHPELAGKGGTLPDAPARAAVSDQQPVPGMPPVSPPSEASPLSPAAAPLSPGGNPELLTPAAALRRDPALEPVAPPDGDSLISSLLAPPPAPQPRSEEPDHHQTPSGNATRPVAAPYPDLSREASPPGTPDPAHAEVQVPPPAVPVAGPHQRRGTDVHDTLTPDAAPAAASAPPAKQPSELHPGPDPRVLTPAAAGPTREDPPEPGDTPPRASAAAAPLRRVAPAPAAEPAAPTIPANPSPATAPVHVDVQERPPGTPAEPARTASGDTGKDPVLYPADQTVPPSDGGPGAGERTAQQIRAGTSPANDALSFGNQTRIDSDTVPDTAAGSNQGGSSGRGGGKGAPAVPDGYPERNPDSSSSQGGEVTSRSAQLKFARVEAYLRGEEAAGNLKPGDRINWGTVSRATVVKISFMRIHSREWAARGLVVGVRGVGRYYQEVPAGVTARPPKRQPVQQRKVIDYILGQAELGTLRRGDPIDVDAVAAATEVKRSTVINTIGKMPAIVGVRGVGSYFQDVPPGVRARPPRRISREQPKVIAYLTKQIALGAVQPLGRIDIDAVAAATGVHRNTVAKALQTMSDVRYVRRGGAYYDPQNDDTDSA